MKTAVIYGASATGQRVYEEVKDKYKVLYFVDENPALIGEKIGGLQIKNRKAVISEKPDFIIMGMLTGYEEAIKYLSENDITEDEIIVKYVDLNFRARKDCLEKIKVIFSEKKIDGAVAELGVYRGDFAKVINEIFPDRKLYLFDTFEGFPDEDLNYEIENNLLLNDVGKLSNTSVDYVLKRMPYRDNCIVCKGYFPDTTVGLEERFAFVNIDVDLYKPILAGLEYFWPRMVDNGYIFIHDYFSLPYAGPRKAVEEFSKKNRCMFIPIGDTLSVAFVKNKGEEL